MNNNFKKLVAETAMLEKLEKRLRDTQVVIKKQKELVAAIKKALASEMSSNGVVNEEVELDGKLYLLTRKRGAWSLQIEDKASVPDSFMREKVTREPDKPLIKDYLMENKANWAQVVRGDDIITYKRKE